MGRTRQPCARRPRAGPFLSPRRRKGFRVFLSRPRVFAAFRAGRFPAPEPGESAFLSASGALRALAASSTTSARTSSTTSPSTTHEPCADGAMVALVEDEARARAVRRLGPPTVVAERDGVGGEQNQLIRHAERAVARRRAHPVERDAEFLVRAAPTPTSVRPCASTSSSARATCRAPCTRVVRRNRHGHVPRAEHREAAGSGGVRETLELVRRRGWSGRARRRRRTALSYDGNAPVAAPVPRARASASEPRFTRRGLTSDIEDRRLLRDELLQHRPVSLLKLEQKAQARHRRFLDLCAKRRHRTRSAPALHGAPCSRIHRAG